MWLVLVGFAVAGAILAVGILRAVRSKNMGYWLPAYLLAPQPREAPDESKPVHIFLAICDHWEPQCNGASPTFAMAKVERWARDARLGPIGGGTDEIMKEILGRQMGL